MSKHFTTPHSRRASQGAALLLALLVMALMATLGSAAYWTQWQALQQETQQRQQSQAVWLMAGAIEPRLVPV